MIKTMQSRRRVNFEDCDPFAHLNNANYLNYFLTAREEQLRTHRLLNIFEHAEKTGNSWAVTAHDIRYLKPARLGEELELWSRMLTFQSFINLIEFVMICPQTYQLKSVMHTQFAYFSIKRSKPVKPEPELTSLFKGLSHFPDRAISSFDINQRIKEIRNELSEYSETTNIKQD